MSQLLPKVVTLTPIDEGQGLFARKNPSSLLPQNFKSYVGKSLFFCLTKWKKPLNFYVKICFFEDFFSFFDLKLKNHLIFQMNYQK